VGKTHVYQTEEFIQHKCAFLHISWRNTKIIVPQNFSHPFMDNNEVAEYCKSGNHVDCNSCNCKCHVPGTIEFLSRNIAKLEKERPGVGESLP
jgi:hypothetical protein